MSEIDLDAIQARAERVAEWRKAFHAPQNSMDYSQRDVPALLAVVRSQQAEIRRYAEQDADAFMKLQVTESQAKLRAKVKEQQAKIERVEAVVDRGLEDMPAWYDGYILADDIRAALTATEGAV